MKTELKLRTYEDIATNGTTCGCGSKNTIIQGISNWHDGTGLCYMYCNDCKKEWNQRWADAE